MTPGDSARVATADEPTLLRQAVGLIRAQRGEEARELFLALAVRSPPTAAGLFAVGAACHWLGRFESALTAFERALALEPGHVEARKARATVLAASGRQEEALAEFRKVSEAAPRDVQTLTNLGALLDQMQRPDEALSSFERALAIDPHHASAWLGGSAVLLRLDRARDALAACDRLIALQPGLSAAHVNRAQALLALDRNEDAMAAADRALMIDRGDARAWFSRAVAAAVLGHFDTAQAAFAQAMAIDGSLTQELLQSARARVRDGRPDWTNRPDEPPDPRVLFLVRGVDRLARCEWDEYEAFLTRFEAVVRTGVNGGDPVTDWSLPFASLWLPLAPDVADAVVDSVAARVVRATAADRRPSRGPDRAPGEPLRIGYLGAGFRRHPSASLHAPIVSRYDPIRVQAYGYALNPLEDSAEAKRYRSAFVRVRDGYGHAPDKIAGWIRDDEIHILVDTTGYSQWGMPEVAALRPAPLNVSLHGSLISARGNWIDYRIGDAVIFPEPERARWREPLALLPRTPFTYECADPIEEASIPDRRALGLPPHGLVFCCFNAAYKIEPLVFDVWMRLLARVPHSVLWLLDDRPAAANLAAQAQRRGVDPRRLVFAPRLPLAQHLARHRCADLFLDTLTCNAHTTAVESLYAGVPLLTLPGATAAGRCAASIVLNAGMPELIADSLSDYEARALRLATDRQAMTEVRTRLARQLGVAPLWDAVGLARLLEQAFEAMWARHRAGWAPASFALPAMAE